jgi:hypothetical protein
MVSTTVSGVAAGPQAAASRVMSMSRARRFIVFSIKQIK